MATNINNTLRNTMMNAINTFAGACSFLFIYNGTQATKTNAPGSVNSAVTGGIALNTANGMGSLSAAGAISLNPSAALTNSTVNGGSITPTWYRIVQGTAGVGTDDGAHTVLQGTAGVTNITNGQDLMFGSTLSNAGYVTITNMTWTDNNA